MKILALLTAFAFMLSAFPVCAQQTGSAAADEKDIGVVIESFRTAIITKDKEALLKLPASETISFLSSVDTGTLANARVERPLVKRMTIGSYAEFVAEVTSGTDRLEEKFSNIVIHADGSVATIWFDYSFEVNGEETNFGHETWAMVNTDNGWKIGSIIYSSTDK
jgi:hypothetical protein